MEFCVLLCEMEAFDGECFVVVIVAFEDIFLEYSYLFYH